VNRRIAWVARVVAVALVLSVPPHRGAAATDTYALRYQSGKLWVTARAVPAADLLKAIAEKTGVRFVVDSEVNPGPITIALDGMPLERAVRNLVAAIPQAAGHTATYAPAATGGSRLVQVALFGPGKTAAEGATVYGESTEPVAPTDDDAVPQAPPTPDSEDRLHKMIAAGVPQETAEKVLDLTREVQNLQKAPVPGTYSPSDLSPESRERLPSLIDRGVPMERAVQMLLLQERYQETLKDVQNMPAGVPPPEVLAPVAESLNATTEEE
jgi:hypothetical protein